LVVGSMAEEENARKCIEIARKYRSTDIDKAIRFLEKSIAIYRTEEAVRLLAEYEREKQKPQQSSQRSSTGHTSTTSNAKASTNPSTNASNNSKQPFTEEQRQIAVKIKKLKSHYEVLGVPKSATERDIKLAYRKLAIKLHPDKNSAPEAEEAFKKLTAAHECLSNEEKRKRYDQFGDDDLPGNVRGGGGGDPHDVTPEDIFNMFFTARGGRRESGGAGGPRHFYRYRSAQPNQEGQSGGSLLQFVHFLPLLLLVLFSFLSSPSSETNPFGLERTEYYNMQRKTSSGMPYYVSNTFQQRYGRDYRTMAQIEAMVEKETLTKYEARCQQEKIEQRSAISIARKSKTAQQAELLAKAHGMELPHCERLKELYNM